MLFESKINFDFMMLLLNLNRLVPLADLLCIHQALRDMMLCITLS